MIDAKAWAFFLLRDYFDIVPGIYHYPDEYDIGTTPYVSASASNNGIGQYIDLEPEFPSNCITTGKVGCNAFYQPHPFCATSDVNVFKPKFDMNEKVALFIVAVINFGENYKWAYGRQCRVGDSKEISVKLPVDDDGNPDWAWMEQYMDSLSVKPITTAVKSSQMPLEPVAWGKFKLSKLFDIKYGVNLELNALEETTEQDPDGIAFVSRSASNNGVTAYVKPVDGIRPQPAETLTVAGGGSVLSTFLQTRPFYSGRDLYLLLDGGKYSRLVKLFIKTVIELDKYRFNYGRQANKSLSTMTVKLPVDDDGNPDWAWMEQYMKSLPYSDRIA